MYIDKSRDIWIVTEMCAEFLESTIDAIVVKDENNPIGVIGGYDLLYNLRQNPQILFQTKIEEIFKPLPSSQ
jgi:signal-transduction protein with cAMP-binding, CBS, and nucleotidyltransferase domain